MTEYEFQRIIEERETKDPGIFHDGGFAPGDTCGRFFCIGTIDIDYTLTSYGCTCHLGHAPCSFCTSDNTHCPDCGWHADIDYIEPSLPFAKRIIADHDAETSSQSTPIWEDNIFW